MQCGCLVLYIYSHQLVTTHIIYVRPPCARTHNCPAVADIYIFIIIMMCAAHIGHGPPFLVYRTEIRGGGAQRKVSYNPRIAPRIAAAGVAACIIKLANGIND